MCGMWYIRKFNARWQYKLNSDRIEQADKSGGGWSRLTRRIASRHGYALTRIGFIGIWPAVNLRLDIASLSREQWYRLSL